MLHTHYVFFHDILPNFNPKPCAHYNEILKRLSLTCKTLHGIYGVDNSERRPCYYCNICAYRDVFCGWCKNNGTTSCERCRCKICGVSANFMGNPWFYGGECMRCSPINWATGEPYHKSEKSD